MNEQAKVIVAVLGALFLGAGGASSILVTRTESEARAELAASNAKLEATREALTSCLSTVDHLTGAKP